MPSLPEDLQEFVETMGKPLTTLSGSFSARSSLFVLGSGSTGNFLGGRGACLGLRAIAFRAKAIATVYRRFTS